MNKKLLATLIAIIAIVGVLGYLFYPKSQEVIIQFKDGTETTISPLSVAYHGKEVNSIILKVNEEVSSQFNVQAESPNGTIPGYKYGEDKWFFYPHDLLDIETMERGVYPVKIVSDLGEIEFNLELRYDLIIIFS